MITWTEILPIVNLIILIAGPLGVYLMIRTSMARTGQEMQEKVRTALHDENELLHQQLQRCEEGERERDLKLDLIVDTLKKKYKIELEIDGKMITLRDGNGTHVTRIKNDVKEN